VKGCQPSSVDGVDEDRAGRPRPYVGKRSAVPRLQDVGETIGGGILPHRQKGEAVVANRREGNARLRIKPRVRSSAQDVLTERKMDGKGKPVVAPSSN
jgi:hypothetical protein